MAFEQRVPNHDAERRAVDITVAVILSPLEVKRGGRVDAQRDAPGGIAGARSPFASAAIDLWEDLG